MVKSGDKLVLKKAMGTFKDVGEVCDVISVEDGIIAFKFGGGMHLGYMSDDELEKYFTIQVDAPKVNADDIQCMIENSEIKTQTLFDKCTVVAMKLENGFVITEASACVSPENYDEKIGYDICMKRIIDKLWELEGYYLQKKEYEKKKDEVNFDW